MEDVKTVKGFPIELYRLLCDINQIDEYFSSVSAVIDDIKGVL